MAELKKVYVGDAVYAAIDEYGDIILTTEDGYRATNRIVLEPEVWTQLLDRVERDLVPAAKTGRAS